MSTSSGNAPTERLLTPLGGICFSLTLTSLGFWLPVISLFA
jgi:hypothetical protein